MIAVIPVAGGQLPPGAGESVAEADGRCLLIGSEVLEAFEQLSGIASETILCEVGAFAPIAWAEALSELLSDEMTIIVPGNADGRALAPHLALATGLELTGPIDRLPDHDAVTILSPGSRSVHPDESLVGETTHLELALVSTGDALLVEVHPADPATVDLSAAKRIVAGGAGLGSPDDLNRLGQTGLGIGASLGATRVLTDAGWLGHDRQIGTTGVEVDPDLYITVGVSGAVQHIMGIGDPDHIISVNTDKSCPMMARSDLALVCDGPEFVKEFERQLAQKVSETDA